MIKDRRNDRKAQRDAIAEYEQELTNRYRCGDQEKSWIANGDGDLIEIRFGSLC